MSSIRLSTLGTDAEWHALRATLDPKATNKAVEGILGQLRRVGAASVLIEDEYLDQDFTAAFSAFYSTVFKRHTKLCRRMHFFKEDITPIIDDAHALQSAQRLEEASQRSYLGFVVARPLAHAPLGRVVLAAPDAPGTMRADVLVHSSYETHVLGASLKVQGIAMTQQDSRIGACAQATIWMAGRHFHMKHRGPWFSTVAITDAATKLTDQHISRSLPAGSEFLTPDNMLRALRAMDREPLLYMADEIRPPPAPGGPWHLRWAQFRPEDVINRYIDSGIPVILGLGPLPGQTVGHAVLATGNTNKQLPAGTALPIDPTKASFCDHFLVHDDQRGSNLRLAIRPGDPHAELPFDLTRHLFYLIAPLPKKVFIPAEYAEKISWDVLRKYAAEWPDHKALHHATLGDSLATGDMLTQSIQAGTIVARTYLTYGWRYKSRMLKNSIGDDFKSILFYHDLPRFVWVTEFGTFDSLNQLDIADQKIFAHSVIDATASRFWESRSIFHAPGMSVRRFHNDSDPFGDMKDATAPISGDTGYLPKIRGRP